MEHHDYNTPSIVDLGPTETLILGDQNFPEEKTDPFLMPLDLVTEFDDE